jgi:beta-glucosidase
MIGYRRVVRMSASEAWNRMRGLDWGIATADNIGAPALTPGERTASIRGVCAPVSGHADRWARDLREVVGVTPVAHRAIVGWPYLQPDGPGGWDRAALDRCDRALDARLAAGLRPSLTLLHTDLPAWLDDEGGWLLRETALRFADFAAELGRRFGDRVNRWITFTDLAAPSLADRVAGIRPPGRGIGAAGLPAVHHVLLAHGLAVRALRDAAVYGKIGSALPLIGSYAATGDPWDRIALESFESWTLRLFLDPLLLSEHMTQDDGTSPVAESGCVRPGDMEIIGGPQDFLGFTWAGSCRIAAPENLARVLPAMGCFGALNDVNRLLVRLGFTIVPFDEVPTSSNGWPIVPEALADAVAAARDLYGDLLPPLYITDSGIGELDTAGPPGRITERRRALLAARLAWLSDVMAEGVDVRGYEYWSVMDNLEWQLRYYRLYGIAVPDREPVTQPPIPCDWIGAGTFDQPRPAASVTTTATTATTTDPADVAAAAGKPGTVRLLRRD